MNRLIRTLLLQSLMNALEGHRSLIPRKLFPMSNANPRLTTLTRQQNMVARELGTFDSLHR